MSDLFVENTIEELQNLKVSQVSQMVDLIITHRDISKLEIVLQLLNHKSVAIRRKVAGNIYKLTNYDIEIIEKLELILNQESDRQTWILLQSSIDKIKLLELGENLTIDKHVYTPSEVIGIIKTKISDKEYTIEGEVCDPKLFYNQYYFGIKDTTETRVDCRVMDFVVANINFPLNEGLSIRIKGKFGLNKQSRLMFNVSFMQLTGEGELYKNLYLLEQKLESEGLFDINNKTPINPHPSNILLIASTNSAAKNDFIKVLSARRGGINIYLLPIKTQGVGVEFEILSKLELAHNYCTDLNIDTIVITRGGGSKDDLGIFNSETVCRKIFALPRPTIVAIGHEIDTTIAEKVADLRASTPSNAAELCSQTNSEILGDLQYHSITQINSLSTRISNYHNFKKANVAKITWNLQSNIIKTQKNLKTNLYSINTTIENTRQDLRQNYKLSLNILYKKNQSLTNSINQNYKFLTQNTWQNMQQIKMQLVHTKELVENNKPENILKKGYTIIRQNKKVIKSKNQLNSNLPIEVQFTDGSYKL